MKQLPSRLRRLNDALADLPLDEPMLLSELDGFLTGIILGPEPIEPEEWLQSVWGIDDGGLAPFDDPLDVQWFADAVMAHHAGIVRDLTRGKPQPVIEKDERNGDMLWEIWLEGFAQAMDLRPDGWAAMAEGDDAAAADALARLTVLLLIAANESPLDSQQINAMQDQAPAELVACTALLYAARLRAGGATAITAITAKPARVGRNDPCVCGSGKKSKRCCGQAGGEPESDSVFTSSLPKPGSGHG